MSVPKGKSACPDRESALQALLFDELELVERKELEHHLAVCSRCRRALEDARRGLAALSTLEKAPLPFNEHEMAAEEPMHPEVAWVDFQKKLRVKQEQAEQRAPSVSSSMWLHRAAAAVVILFVGIGVGRWGTAPRKIIDEKPTVQPASLDELKVEAQAVEALTRAELLSDVGLRYVHGLQTLLQGVMDTPAGGVRPADLTSTREDALELIRDGRLLRRSLDPARDAAFLATINRSEVFLEELTAVESDSAGRGVELIQATLRGSRLLFQIAALNVEKEVDIALAASGWTGEELVERKEF